MADREHLAILKRGSSAWNEWRGENPQVVPDLSQAHLQQARLSGANLSGANLRPSYFGQADLSGADLCHADLSETSLRRAYLASARLDNANLVGARRARMEQLEPLRRKSDRRRCAGSGRRHRGQRVPFMPATCGRTRIWAFCANRLPRLRRRAVLSCSAYRSDGEGAGASGLAFETWDCRLRVDRHPLHRRVRVKHRFGKRGMRVNREHELVYRSFQFHHRYRFRNEFRSLRPDDVHA